MSEVRVGKARLDTEKLYVTMVGEFVMFEEVFGDLFMYNVKFDENPRFCGFNKIYSSAFNVGYVLDHMTFEAIKSVREVTNLYMKPIY